MKANIMKKLTGFLELCLTRDVATGIMILIALQIAGCAGIGQLAIKSGITQLSLY
jgi:hypothetical protein